MSWEDTSVSGSGRESLVRHAVVASSLFFLNLGEDKVALFSLLSITAFLAHFPLKYSA